MNDLSHDNPHRDPGHATAKPRRALRWTVALPVLTLLLFGGLCLLTFLQIDWKSLEKADHLSSARLPSTDVLARYGAETRKLGEIRRQKRSGFAVGELLRSLRPPLQTPAVLLADFQALRKRQAESVPELLRSIVPLWTEELRNKATARELDLVQSLFLQAVVSLEAPPALSATERSAVFDLAGELVARPDRGLGTVILYLDRVAAKADLWRLAQLAQAVSGNQDRLELQKIIERLGGKPGGIKVTDVR